MRRESESRFRCPDDVTSPENENGDGFAVEEEIDLEVFGSLFRSHNFASLRKDAFVSKI